MADEAPAPTAESSSTQQEASTGVLKLQIVNIYTWPQPAQRFPFDAESSECGEELHNRVAAHIGYLALDMMLVRANGEAVADATTLAEQDLAEGEELRITRRSCLSGEKRSATPALGDSADALAPASVTLERYCRSAFALNCLEVMPAAPVLLRMLQLDHGCLPDLSSRCDLQRSKPAAELINTLLEMDAIPQVDTPHSPPSAECVAAAATAAAASAAVAILANTPLAPIRAAVKKAAIAAVRGLADARTERTDRLDPFGLYSPHSASISQLMGIKREGRDLIGDDGDLLLRPLYEEELGGEVGGESKPPGGLGAFAPAGGLGCGSPTNTPVGLLTPLSSALEGQLESVPLLQMGMASGFEANGLEAGLGARGGRLPAEAEGLDDIFFDFFDEWDGSGLQAQGLKDGPPRVPLAACITDPSPARRNRSPHLGAGVPLAACRTLSGASCGSSRSMLVMDLLGDSPLSLQQRKEGVKRSVTEETSTTSGLPSSVGSGGSSSFCAMDKNPAKRMRVAGAGGGRVHRRRTASESRSDSDCSVDERDSSTGTEAAGIDSERRSEAGSDGARTSSEERANSEARSASEARTDASVRTAEAASESPTRGVSEARRPGGHGRERKPSTAAHDGDALGKAAIRKPPVKTRSGRQVTANKRLR
jgi:hypothetical protein